MRAKSHCQSHFVIISRLLDEKGSWGGHGVEKRNDRNDSNIILHCVKEGAEATPRRVEGFHELKWHADFTCPLLTPQGCAFQKFCRELYFPFPAIPSLKLLFRPPEPSQQSHSISMATSNSIPPPSSLHLSISPSTP